MAIVRSRTTTAPASSVSVMSATVGQVGRCAAVDLLVSRVYGVSLERQRQALPTTCITTNDAPPLLFRGDLGDG